MKKLQGRAAACKEALATLSEAIEEAQRKLEEAQYAVSMEELGEVFVCFSRADKGLYISNSWGRWR